MDRIGAVKVSISNDSFGTIIISRAPWSSVLQMSSQPFDNIIGL